MTTMGFLASDDRYEIDLPAHLALAEIRAVVTAGRAWRALTYRPDAAAHPASRGGLVPVRREVTASGVQATVYEDADDPGARVLDWHLDRSAIVTYFNAHEADAVETYLDAIRVEPGAPPRISLGSPFRGGDLRDEEQRDAVVWRSGPADREQVLAVSRLPRGRRAEAAPESPAGWFIRTAQAADDLKVMWGGPDSAQEEIEAGIGSLAASIRRAA